MKEITCPSGLKVKLRGHTPPVIRMVQPNLLIEDYEAAKSTESYTVKSEIWLRRIEKLLKIIVADPPIFIPDDIDDEIPPGHIASYDLSDDDMGFIFGEWMGPIYAKMEELENNTTPLSETPTDS